MWSKGGEEARGGEARGEMLWMWRKGTQEVGMSKHEEEKTGGGNTAAESVEENEKAQWSKRTAPKGSSNVYGGVDNTQRSGDFCGV